VHLIANLLATLTRGMS